jgi:hypothetical protein
MADVSRLMEALKNADAAGDTAAATRFAQMIREAQIGDQQPKGTPAHVATPQPPIAWGDVPGMAMKNIGPSAKQFGSDIVQPFLHPVETAKSLGNLGLGIIQKVIPGEQEAEKYADAVGQFFADRYGGEEELKRTLATDPVGFLADVSTVLTGGGALAAKLPGMAGKVGQIAGTAGRAIDPLTQAIKAPAALIKGVNNPAAKRLMAEGVSPTIGQVLGGGFKKAEDALESIPVLGSAIGAGRQRANRQLNTAAYNRALRPIGETAKGIPTGAEGISHVSDKLSSAYDNLLDRVNLVPDNQLIDDIATAVDNVSPTLDRNAVKVLGNIIDIKIVDKISSGQPISGAQLKVIESDLGKLASDFGSSATAADRAIGSAIQNAQSAIRDALVRSNPSQASELRAINEGYANYARIRKAGSAAGAELSEGFTPAQLRTAIKAEDRSVKKGDFARGRALMQDLSTDARTVMGGNLPTTGTTERGILAALLAGGAYLDPVTAGVVAVGSAPYMPGVQGSMARALLSRPEVAVRGGQALQQYGPRVGAASFQAGRNERMQSALGVR